jgi:hypothetical protein
LTAERKQLFDRSRTVYVRRDEQRSVTARTEIEPYLGGVGGLARALQTHKHDDRGVLRRAVERDLISAEQTDQFVIDNADDLLSWCEAFQNFGAD